MKVLTYLACLFVTTSVYSETLVIPVSDLLFDTPNFSSPSFSINSAINGTVTIEGIQKDKRIKNTDKELLKLLKLEFPDAKNIRIWRGNAIIKL